MQKYNLQMHKYKCTNVHIQIFYIPSCQPLIHQPNLKEIYLGYEQI